MAPLLSTLFLTETGKERHWSTTACRWHEAFRRAKSSVDHGELKKDLRAQGYLAVKCQDEILCQLAQSETPSEKLNLSMCVF